MEMRQIPKDKCLDHTLTLLKEGYLFIPNRTRDFHSDIFETRLLGKKVICISGRKAAEVFYHPKYFKRKGALPKRIQKTLFGVSAVQTMDGRQHEQRKNLFLSILNEENEDRLVEITKEKWSQAMKRWERKENIVLFDEVNRILCQAVCEWAGVPLSIGEVSRRTRDFRAMVDNFGKVGRKYWQGKKARKRTETWIQKIIEDTRAGKLRPQKNSALFKVAFYKEGKKGLLASKMAAVELINILRPIIAASRFIVFLAVSLHEHEIYKEKLLSGDDQFKKMYVEEVRRYYPFAPFLGAIAKKSFRWNGYKMKKGTLVLLDLYGTNHDARIWKDPNEFRPERFAEKTSSAFELIPQGGGKTDGGHRCPGENVTAKLMKVSLDFLIHDIEYTVPDQDSDIPLNKIPAFPQSGFIISNVKL